MGKYKYLLKNIGLLTLSSFATKLLSFFLVPLYTSILTATEYGIYDLFGTTIGVLLPIITLNIQEAVLRFALDKRYERKALVTVSIRYLLISLMFVFAGLAVNHFFEFSTIIKKYSVFFFLMYFVQALSGIVLAYVRGIDKIAELSVSSVVASAITIGCNILFLVVFKWRLIGYFLANLIGSFVQCIYLMLKTHMIYDIHLKNKYATETTEMLEYCKPMIANNIAWWINNSSDRYVIILFLGLAANGVYSVASKIPSILNIFQSIFSQAWTLSVVNEFDSEDKNGFFANTYKAYNCAMVILCSAIIVADKVLAKIIYSKDFYVAWKYVPWLTIAIVFGALSGYIGAVFSAVRNSKIFAQSTMIGAVSNIVLNILLTPVMGALGAAIATAVCYFVVWIVRYRHSKRYIKLRINIYRDIATYVILVAQAIALLMTSRNVLTYGVQGLLFLTIFVLYINDIKLVLTKILGR